jgi:hypothetical protein
MKNNNLVYTFKGVIYKVQKGAKTVNLYTEDSGQAFNNFSINEDIKTYEDLERAVIEWNAINNIHSKVVDWVELQEIEDFFECDLVDTLEEISGFRELFTLATITKIVKLDKEVRFYGNLSRYFSLNKEGKVVN